MRTNIALKVINMQENETFARYESQMKQRIRNENSSNDNTYSKAKSYMSAIYKQDQLPEKVIGGLYIVYAPGSFMSVDRISMDQKGKFVKQRRIIFYLDSRPGQIGCTLLLQLLKIKNGAEFSKHKFVQQIDEEFFQGEGINISSGEINEALSRMFRKTMSNFFEIVGRTLIRKNFVVRINELSPRSKTQSTYSYVKREIDDHTKSLVRELNRL